jgi:ATP-binding cassette subfamily F protein uup
MVISHDRYFLDRTVDKIFSIGAGERIGIYEGNFSETIEARARDAKMFESARKAGSKSVPERPLDRKRSENKAGRAPKLSYKEKRELESIEAEISDLERSLKGLHDELGIAQADHKKLLKLSTKIGEVEKKIERAMARWEELAPLA